MNIYETIKSAGLIALIASPIHSIASEEISTDWLEAKSGSSGEALEAEVVKVTSKGDITVVDVIIPVKDLENYEIIEVIGKKSGKVITPVKKPELLLSDGEPYGYRIQLKRLPGFEFKLQLNDTSNDSHQ